MEKLGVQNDPFLILIFCKFLDYESIPIKATLVKVSKKVQNLIMNSCKNFHGHGLSHFCAKII